uniref:Glutaredoxin-1 n=1 Tax=Bos taurus TaxID=9913 RepID=A0AAA9TJ71_BOVIN
MRASWSVSRSFYFQALPTVEVYPPEGGSMAQAFVNSKIQPGKVVVFIKPTCPYCRKTQELLSQLPFKQGLLEFVDITAAGNISEIQDYLQQLTGARTYVPSVLGEDPLVPDPSGSLFWAGFFTASQPFCNTLGLELV